jgi:hypothetical protein
MIYLDIQIEFFNNAASCRHVEMLEPQTKFRILPGTIQKAYTIIFNKILEKNGRPASAPLVS